MELAWEPFSIDDLEGPKPPGIEPGAEGQAMILAILEQIAAFSAVPARVASNSRRMRQRGVRFSPCEWFGDWSVAQRQRYSRTATRLERDGYLVRITERRRNRATHVQPTCYALTWALEREIVPDLAALTSGLRRTEWGFDLATHLESSAASASAVC